MAANLGYLLLAAGTITFLVSYFDKPGKRLPLVFAATMMVVAGLAILQFVGSPAPGLS